MTIVKDNMHNAYRQICDDLYLEGDDVVTRGLGVRELLDVELVIENPHDRFIGNAARNVDMLYLMGELCFFLDSRTDLKSIAYYSKFWNKISDDGETVNSAYGSRLFNTLNMYAEKQFGYALKCLMEDQYSRKAVMTIYDRDDARKSSDNPCTMFLQLIIRNDKLHLYSFMRSNDVWLGLPYDVAFFTLIQEIAYTILKPAYPNLDLGAYHHHATSMHCYEQHIDELWNIKHNKAPDHVIAPTLVDIDVTNWFDDILTYEKAFRGVVQYSNESRRTPFQDWCKQWFK